MPPEPDLLSKLLSIAELLFGALLAAAVIPWLAILLHEVAHATAARLVGASVLGGSVGSGRHVLPVRWFGARWELRALPTHGHVEVEIPPDHRFRGRLALVLLAGPLVSGVIACALLRYLVSLPAYDAVPLEELHRFVFFEGFVRMATVVTSMQFVFCLLPWSLRMGFESVPSDLHQLVRLLRLDRQALERWMLDSANEAAGLRAWRVFLDGGHEEALAMHRRIPVTADTEASHRYVEAFLVWPLEGAAAALAVVEEASRTFGAWAARQGEGEAAAAVAPHAAAFRHALLQSRAFFAALADRPELMTIAARARDELLAAPERGGSVRRNCGIVELHAGNPAVAVHLLRRAWRDQEPCWARAITAAALALGHAMRGDDDEARRWLRKAKRLHPECVLLPEYEARIRAAALPAAGAAAP